MCFFRDRKFRDGFLSFSFLFFWEVGLVVDWGHVEPLDSWVESADEEADDGQIARVSGC